MLSCKMTKKTHEIPCRQMESEFEPIKLSECARRIGIGCVEAFCKLIPIKLNLFTKPIDSFILVRD